MLLHDLHLLYHKTLNIFYFIFLFNKMFAICNVFPMSLCWEIIQGHAVFW